MKTVPLFLFTLFLLIGLSTQELLFSYSFTNDSIIPYYGSQFYSPPNITQYIRIVGKVIGTPETKDDASINFVVMTLKNFYLLTQGQQFDVVHVELFSNSIFYEEKNVQKYQNESGLILLWQNLDVIFGRATRIEYTANLSLQIPIWFIFVLVGGLLCCCCSLVITFALVCGIIGSVIYFTSRKSSLQYFKMGESSSIPKVDIKDT